MFAECLAALKEHVCCVILHSFYCDIWSEESAGWFVQETDIPSETVNMSCYCIVTILKIIFWMHCFERLQTWGDKNPAWLRILRAGSWLVVEHLTCKHLNVNIQYRFFSFKKTSLSLQLENIHNNLRSGITPFIWMYNSNCSSIARLLGQIPLYRCKYYSPNSTQTAGKHLCHTWTSPVESLIARWGSWPNPSK